MIKKYNWVLSKNMEAYLLFMQFCVLMTCLYYAPPKPIGLIPTIIYILGVNATGSYVMTILFWLADWRERFIPLVIFSVSLTIFFVLVLFIQGGYHA